MPEWLYEAGIGECRAALIENDTIIEAHIEPADTGLRAGEVIEARLTEILIPARRGIVTAAGGEQALLEPLPKGLTQGGLVTVEIVREAIPERGVVKRAKARVWTEAARESHSTLLARITATGHPIRHLTPYDSDALEAAGWSEALEQGASGIIPFEGGSLRISLTPAMTLIDVDGHLPPAALALASSKAAAAAIRCFNITGSIGIDFPTLGNKAERLATADAFDAVLPLPFERTAINGFGFLQIIRPRYRASVCEQLQHARIPTAARALLRQAQRSGIIGSAAITAHPSVIAHLTAHPDWIETLATQRGGAISLQADASLAISAGYVSKA